MSASIGDTHSSEEEDLYSRYPSGRLPSGISGDGDVDLQGHDVELMGEVMDEDLGEGLSGHHGYDEPVESEEQPQSPTFDPTAEGLKEINNLAHFGVSSHKPGSGVEELLSEDLSKYWQSDGQQPHLLTIHFLRRVEIRAIRFYVDYNEDESYTPTHIVFYAGTGHHDLIQFAEMPLSNPVGWQDVPVSDCGGGPDGHSLCCWIVQMHVKENHQNGKDTHIRGIKIYALDENSAGSLNEMEVNIDQAADWVAARSNQRGDHQTFQELLDELNLDQSATRYRPGEGGFSNLPDFMRDPEIR